MFPAYAGVIPKEELYEDEEESVPRVCGGDPGITEIDIHSF